MKTSEDLTLDQANTIIDALKLPGTEWRQWGRRSDGERLALGVVILSKHLKGMSMRDIEAEMGIPLATAQRYKERALQSLTMPTVDEARREELERLEAIIKAVWPAVENGDEKAIASYMKVSERRAKLLGMDKPILVEQTVTEVTAQEAELRAMLAQAERDEAVRESMLVKELSE